MKLVLVSNFGDETYAESIIETNVSEDTAKAQADAWNEANTSDHSYGYCVAKQDDYKLWRGMEDLV